MSDEEDQHAENSDLVWGMRAIAREINRSVAQAYRLNALGKLRGVKKLNHRTIVGSRKELRRLAEPDTNT